MEDHNVNDSDILETDEIQAGSTSAESPGEESRDAAIRDLNDKYVRLYAEFDNYRKRISREKEELVKHGNESLLHELLPVIDNLELALKHVSGDSDSGLVRGVEMTLKELQRTLEKFGLSEIESEGRPFDPTVHHAMTQVERADMEEKMVAEELRKGYLFKGKVLRPSLVAVSAKPRNPAQDISDAEGAYQEARNEEDRDEDVEIKIKKTEQ